MLQGKCNQVHLKTRWLRVVGHDLRCKVIISLSKYTTILLCSYLWKGISATRTLTASSSTFWNAFTWLCIAEIYSKSGSKSCSAIGLDGMARFNLGKARTLFEKQKSILISISTWTYPQSKALTNEESRSSLSWSSSGEIHGYRQTGWLSTLNTGSLPEDPSRWMP